MNYTELFVFIVYFLFMLGIGFYFFAKSKDSGEKDYFLGGRQMGAWVSALSAGASDMSAWVLMGLPASVFAAGMGQTWIAIGLGIGYALSWIFEAPRLRRFSIRAGDSITIPQYLTNRFLSKSKLDLPRLRLQDAAAEEEEGGFARAVSTQHGHPLPLGDGKGELLHRRRRIGVGIGDARKAQYGLAHPGSTSLERKITASSTIK